MVHKVSIHVFLSTVLCIFPYHVKLTYAEKTVLERICIKF